MNLAVEIYAHHGVRLSATAKSKPHANIANPAQSVASHFTDNYEVEQFVALGYDAVLAYGSFKKFQRAVIHLQ